jgi:hypothetical protein
MINISNKLKVKKASMYSFIHENKLTGLKRALFWDFTIKFEPEFILINHEKRDLESSLSCGWMRIPVMDYKEIKYFQFDKDNPSGIESTFYLHEHNFFDELSGSISFDNSTFFNLNISFKHHNKYAFDEEIIIDKHFSTQLEYTGLIVIPENINIEKNDIEAVKKVAAEYVNLEDYYEPNNEKGFRYDFKPKQ